MKQNKIRQQLESHAIERSNARTRKEETRDTAASETSAALTRTSQQMQLAAMQQADNHV
jgi:hypothetical protein